LVPDLTASFGVLATVDFDAKPKRWTIEVKCEWPDRMLAPEIYSAELIAPDYLPKLPLRISQIGP
jgi:hypothetical protein